MLTLLYEILYAEMGLLCVANDTLMHNFACGNNGWLTRLNNRDVGLKSGTATVIVQQQVPSAIAADSQVFCCTCLVVGQRLWTARSLQLMTGGSAEQCHNHSPGTGNITHGMTEMTVASTRMALKNVVCDMAVTKWTTLNSTCYVALHSEGVNLEFKVTCLNLINHYSQDPCNMLLSLDTRQIALTHWSPRQLFIKAFP